MLRIVFYQKKTCRLQKILYYSILFQLFAIDVLHNRKKLEAYMKKNGDNMQKMNYCFPYNMVCQSCIH